MFLFTPSPGPAEAPKTENPIFRPLRAAAKATGISFDYLVRTAKRESNLNPEARAGTSSATGLFQFIEQTWLGLVKREGAEVGIDGAAEAIRQDRNGRYTVPDPQAREKILALRKDPEVAARLAGVFTRDNQEQLRAAIGRNPTGGELYIAHFLGPQGASEFISRAEAQPNLAAARAFPEAARANRPIFFDGKGRARTMREVYARLVSFHDGVAPNAPSGAATAVAAAEAGATRSPLAVAAKAVPPTGAPRAVGRPDNALHGLFRSGGDGKAAERLRQTWTGFAAERQGRSGPSFFPRGEGVKVASLAPEQVGATLSDAPPPEVATTVEAPLPPRAATAAPPVDGSGPLDLLRFLRRR